jgi:NAD(P)-dependent dehydrogenase (short-subunit alcohol dehydrogenase family)
MSLAGKTVVVIGGSSGLGLGIARLAAQAGARVVIASRSADKLAQARESIVGEVETRRVDVRDEASVRQLFTDLGELDHLATPGNEGARGPFLEMSTAQARAGFDSKFWGQYLAARYAAPHIRPGGSIVLVAGTNSQRPGKSSVVMAAINAAVEGLARGLAVELAPLRVNCVSPGPVDTPLWNNLSAEQRQEMYARGAAEAPVGRIGQPEDIARAALYLMENGYVSGTTLFVDGGKTLR